VSRTKRAGIAVGFGYLQFALAIVSGIALVPFVLHQVGSERYGLWLGFGELVAYSARVDGGVLGVLPWLVAERDGAGDRQHGLATASAALEAATRRQFLERIPVRKRDEVVILQVRQIASVVAEGELLHLTTLTNERYTISHRLHALESRLDPRRFVRLGRGSLAAVDQIQRVSPMPGGTFQVTLTNGQTLQVSRLQSRVLRETLLRI
jgi:hypothetical protein